MRCESRRTMVSYSTPTARLQGLYYYIRANHSPHPLRRRRCCRCRRGNAVMSRDFRLLVSKQHSRFFSGTPPGKNGFSCNTTVTPAASSGDIRDRLRKQNWTSAILVQGRCASCPPNAKANRAVIGQPAYHRPHHKKRMPNLHPNNRNASLLRMLEAM